MTLQMSPKELHRSATIIDACAPIMRDCSYADFWLQGGATCALATLALHDDTRVSTIAAIGRLNRQIRDREDVVLARSVGDIRNAKQNGRLAVVMMFQSGAGLDQDVNMVDIYYQLGVRSMNLAYNQAEAAVDGCMEPRDGGVTLFGRQVIAEMNRVGMLLDLSHTGYRGSMEAMDLSEAPVVFTHSNPKAVFDHPRNIRDDQIRRCAELGGVIGLNGHPIFVREGTAAPTLEDFMRHIDYMADKAGIDHVGLGLDFSQPPGQQMTAQRYSKLMAEDIWTEKTLPPPPWSYPVPDASRLELITEALLKRNWSNEDIRKVMGENFLRVFGAVWK